MREMHKGTLPAGAPKGKDGDVPTVPEEGVGHQACLPDELGDGALGGKDREDRALEARYRTTKTSAKRGSTPLLRAWPVEWLL